MVLLQRVPVIACHNPECSARTVLPHQILQGRFGYQGYWPKDSGTLSFACPDCGHLSAYKESDVRQEQVQVLAPGQLPNAWWRAKFSCGKENCGLPIVVHTKTCGPTRPGQVVKLVGHTKPPSTCSRGHELSDNCELIDLGGIVPPDVGEWVQ